MGWPKDIHYAFFGNVVRGKSALFRLVVRNGFAHFVRKVFARRKLLPGKFWVFAPLVVWTFDNCVYRFSNKLEYIEKQKICPSFPGLVLACEELWGITQMEVLNPRRISQNFFNFVIV